MRSELLTYLKGAVNAQIKISDELPWSTSGTPLYNKNLKYIYLDEEQHELVDLISLINAPAIQNQIDRVSGYLTVDAKNLPSQIDSVITTIRAATNATPNLDVYHTKTFNMETSINGDQITYSFEYVFTKLN